MGGMKSGFIGTVVAACLLAGSAVAVGAQEEYLCGDTDIAELSQDGWGAVGEVYEGKSDGAAASWINCQFRFYDDNDRVPDDPEVPHVFTNDEPFVGGPFTWIADTDFGDYGVDSWEGAREVLESGAVTVRLYWGPADAPDDLAEVELIQTPYREQVAPIAAPGVVFLADHRYHVFESGTLDPGTYAWRMELDGPMIAGTEHGQVEIIEASPAK